MGLKRESKAQMAHACYNECQQQMKMRIMTMLVASIMGWNPDAV